MGFLNRLRKATAAQPSDPQPNNHPTASDVTHADHAASEYDRAIWRKKLKTILDRLPDSAADWPTLIAEANSLDFGHAWTQECLRAEFELLVRKAVGDRVVSADEHAKLDQARKLIGLDEAEAIALVDRIVADAEAFFGKKVDQE